MYTNKTFFVTEDGKQLDPEQVAEQLASCWADVNCDRETIVDMMLNGEALPDYSDSTYEELAEDFLNIFSEKLEIVDIPVLKDPELRHLNELRDEIATKGNIFGSYDLTKVNEAIAKREAELQAASPQPTTDTNPKCDCGGTKLKLPHSDWCSLKG